MPSAKLRRVAKMEADTRERWEAAWDRFWEDVWRPMPGAAIDALSRSWGETEAEREAYNARIDATLARFAEEDPPWEEAERYAPAWNLWTDTVWDTIDAAHGGDLTTWPHTLPEPPPEATLGPCERPRARALFTRMEGTEDEDAAAWPLYWLAVLDATRAART